MKKYFLMTAAAFAMTATVATAMDIGSTGVQFNSDLVAEYNTDSEVFATTYSPELRYIPLESVSMYVSTDLDLQDIDFTGATVGVEYAPGVAGLNLVAYVKSTVDSDFEFSGATIGAELKF
jgi:hypothetical protein